ncbi:secreted protein, putative, partial [Ixodes scapularis]
CKINSTIRVHQLFLSVGLEKKEEESDHLDVIVDNEVKKVGEEPVLIGQILRECAKGLEVRVAKHEHFDNETAEYIIRRIWSGLKKAIKKTAQVVVNVGKAIIPKKVVSIVKDLFQKKMGEYALAEDKSSGSLVLALPKDMDDLGKALIEKGVHLCEACKMKKLGDAEMNFVEDFVSAF